MINKEIITAASEAGLPAIKELFNKLSKEDALKGLGLMIILGISKMAIEAVKDIVMNKMPGEVVKYINPKDKNDNRKSNLIKEK